MQRNTDCLFSLATAYKWDWTYMQISRNLATLPSVRIDCSASVH